MTVQKLTATDAMLSEINRGLMVQWINADLFNRHGYDVRKSIVLYDEHRMFATAFHADEIPGIAVAAENQTALDTLHGAGIRYWSHGIV